MPFESGIILLGIIYPNRSLLKCYFQPGIGQAPMMKAGRDARDLISPFTISPPPGRGVEMFSTERKFIYICVPQGSILGPIYWVSQKKVWCSRLSIF